MERVVQLMDEIDELLMLVYEVGAKLSPRVLIATLLLIAVGAPFVAF
jgi:hypothetical protein